MDKLSKKSKQNSKKILGKLSEIPFFLVDVFSALSDQDPFMLFPFLLSDQNGSRSFQIHGTDRVTGLNRDVTVTLLLPREVWIELH